MTPSAQLDTPDPNVLPSCTLVLWSTCLAVGVLGPMWHLTSPSASNARPVELVAEILHVDSISPAPQLGPASSTALPPSAPIRSLPQPPPPPAPVAAVIPAAPQWMALREPTPSKAPPQFAAPLQRANPVAPIPTQTGQTHPSGSNTSEPSPTGLVGSQGSSGGAPQTLVYGQGEGIQPAPRYPTRAKAAGQQGTVLVRFTVGEDGRVLTAEISRPSPWPLLDEEALRTVRHQYRFQPGRFRFYEIGIRFELGR